MLCKNISTTAFLARTLAVSQKMILSLSKDSSNKWITHLVPENTIPKDLKNMRPALLPANISVDFKMESPKLKDNDRYFALEKEDVALKTMFNKQWREHMDFRLNKCPGAIEIQIPLQFAYYKGKSINDLVNYAATGINFPIVLRPMTKSDESMKVVLEEEKILLHLDAKNDGTCPTAVECQKDEKKVEEHHHKEHKDEKKKDKKSKKCSCSDPSCPCKDPKVCKCDDKGCKCVKPKKSNLV